MVHIGMHKPAASSFADMCKCYDCQDSTAMVVQSSIDNFSNVLKQECGILRIYGLQDEQWAKVLRKKIILFQ